MAPFKGEVRSPLTLERTEGSSIDDRVEGAMTLGREDVAMDALTERERTAKLGRSILFRNPVVK